MTVAFSGPVVRRLHQEIASNQYTDSFQGSVSRSVATPCYAVLGGVLGSNLAPWMTVNTRISSGETK